LARTPAASRIALPAPVDLDDSVAADALREVLVGRPDAGLLDRVVGVGEVRRRGERVVGLELDHRPDDDPHRRERLLERMELRKQRRLDPGRRLVAGPEIVAERLDHVVGGDADVGLAALDDLEHRLQDADDRAQGPVGALGEAAQPVEVAEQLVRSVDEVDDHAQ
jgi:hypothetical protein